MAEVDGFGDFLKRIRAGDDAAATELVRQYEPLIRREIKLQLEDRRLARFADSSDICQSVLASFFVRAAHGQYNLEKDEDLVKLLVQMAHNKVASTARFQSRQKRDHRRARSIDTDLPISAKNEPTPSEFVAGKELLDRFRAELSQEENAIAELRNQGMEWQAIADRLGGTPQSRRMQLNRALSRVAVKLGLELSEHG